MSDLFGEVVLRKNVGPFKAGAKFVWADQSPGGARLMYTMDDRINIDAMAVLVVDRENARDGRAPRVTARAT